MIESWTATLLDGTRLTSEEAGTIERVHERGGCRALQVKVAGRDPIHVACVPENGERIHLFTRRGIIWGIDGTGEQHVDMPVIEIGRSDGTPTRLYVHPEHGLVFSTLNLNL